MKKKKKAKEKQRQTQIDVEETTLLEKKPRSREETMEEVISGQKWQKNHHSYLIKKGLKERIERVVVRLLVEVEYGLNLVDQHGLPAFLDGCAIKLKAQIESELIDKARIDLQPIWV